MDTSGYNLQRKRIGTLAAMCCIIIYALQRLDIIVQTKDTYLINITFFLSRLWSYKTFPNTILSVNSERATAHLPLLPLTRASLTQMTATIWWKILQILAQGEKRVFFLPRQPEPTPLQLAAVKLLGPPCRCADTTLLKAAFHRLVRRLCRLRN